MEALIAHAAQDLKDSDIQNINQDLLLAAEIGKSLLERNRELEAVLKSTQDYAEEQAAQVDFYLKQVEILREANESCSHACEQLESKNQQLHDEYDQQKGEYKILEGKNNRLWDVINSIEKRNEELSTEVTNLKILLNEVDDKSFQPLENSDELDHKQIEPSYEKSDNEKTVPENLNQTHYVPIMENENLKTLVSELKVRLKVGKWHKEEMESQIDDVLNENQLLHHKIANLNQEIHEWENFAQKEECYRRLADAFSQKHNIEEDHDYVPSLFSTSSQGSPNTRSNLTKAKSCEFLSDTNRIHTEMLKSPNLVNNVLSSVNSSSFLSELDTEYADLVKRYESLLEKCKQEGRFNENPERTRKVQRAIQTLSFDFTKLTSPVTTPSKENRTFSKATKNAAVSTGISTSPCECQCQTNFSHENGIGIDYRKLFADIFAKIKESKEQYL